MQTYLTLCKETYVGPGGPACVLMLEKERAFSQVKGPLFLYAKGLCWCCDEFSRMSNGTLIKHNVFCSIMKFYEILNEFEWTMYYVERFYFT